MQGDPFTAFLEVGVIICKATTMFAFAAFAGCAPGIVAEARGGSCIPKRRCVALPFVDRTASPHQAQPWDAGNDNPGTVTWALFDLR